MQSVFVWAALCTWLAVQAFGEGTQAPLLDIATGVAKWLEATSHCHDTADGKSCSWKMNSTDGAPANYPYLSRSLYYGSAGEAVFLSQLANATNGSAKQRWTALAIAAIQNVREGVASDIIDYGVNAGFYYGLAGIAWGLRMVGQSVSNSGGYFAAATQIENHILNKVLPFSTNSEAKLWNNTDIAHGASGTGLAFLWAAGQEVDPVRAHVLRSGAVAAGKWLLQQAQKVPHGDGLRWWRGADTDGEHTGDYYPSFCCGTAGVGYFLADLSLVQDMDHDLKESFVDAARQAGKHVLSVSVEPEKGVMLLPHGEQKPDTSVYFLGWCGGAPGWARLFVKLWQATHEVIWLESLEAAVKGIQKYVLPDLNMMLPVGKDGVWQNLGQCCGAAAAGNFLLELSQSDLPLPEAIKSSAKVAAQKIAAAISALAVRTDTGIVLPSAEEHLQPGDKRWQAGWMQGASGIASFLLHMHAVDTGSHAGVRQPWPDEPWQSRSAEQLRSFQV